MVTSLCRYHCMLYCVGVAIVLLHESLCYPITVAGQYKAATTFETMFQWLQL